MRGLSLTLSLLVSLSALLVHPIHSDTHSHINVNNRNTTMESDDPPSVGSVSFTPVEDEHILSVTVRIYCPAEGAVIYYTVDGSEPSPESLSISSGQVVVIDTIGDVPVRAYCHADGMLDSDIADKTYHVLERCSKPSIFPNGGTFAGSVSVELSSSTPESSVYYTLDDSSPREGGSGSLYSAIDGLTLSRTATLKAVAVKNGLAPSPIATARFVLLPKVANPVILPTTTVFAISATLTITCATPNATVYYTTDGTNPTLSSLVVDSLSHEVIIDTPGQHTIKVMATVESMLASDVITKDFTILTRASPPELLPAPATFIKQVAITLSCEVGVEGIVYYTTDGLTTPSAQSPHVNCGGEILLTGPGKFVIRAFVSVDHKSPSAIVEGNYVVLRPPYDTYPVLRNVTLQARPMVDVSVVAKTLPHPAYTQKRYCPDRDVRGRLVVLHNPVGHFDFLQPAGGCGSGLSLPSVSGQQTVPSPLPSHIEFYQDDISAALPEQIRDMELEYNAASVKGCEVVLNAGFFNITSTACFGDIVTAGEVVQTSNKHSVNFGIRNGEYVVGHVDSEEVTGESNNTEWTGFDTLVSGIVWLVRDGKVFVDESLHPEFGEAEDMSGQTAGSSFATVLSARTAIGHDKEGRLLFLQVEGETWVRGMSLYEFAEFAVELGFVSAINLDGGGSATMTVNNTLVSEPSWKCTHVDAMREFVSSEARHAEGLYDTDGAVYRTMFKGLEGKKNVAVTAVDGDGFKYCEKPVASVACIHSMAPPYYHSPAKGGSSLPSLAPSLSPKDNTHTSHPSVAIESDDDVNGYVVDPGNDILEPTMPPTWRDEAGVGNASVSRLQAAYDMLLESENFYRTLCYILSMTLALSFCIHLVVCWMARPLRGKPSSLVTDSDKESLASSTPLSVSTSSYYRSEDANMEQLEQGDGRGVMMTTQMRDRLVPHENGSNAMTSAAGASWQEKISKIDFSNQGSSDDDLECIGSMHPLVLDEDESDVTETAGLVRHHTPVRDSNKKSIYSSSARKTSKKKISRDEEDFGDIYVAEPSESGSWFRRKKKKGDRKKKSVTIDRSDYDDECASNEETALTSSYDT